MISYLFAKGVEKFEFQEHEAIAIEVEGIGERCHLNVISGLPELLKAFVKFSL